MLLKTPIPTIIFRAMVMFAHETGRLPICRSSQGVEDMINLMTYVHIIILVKSHIEETCSTYIAVTLSMQHGKG